MHHRYAVFLFAAVLFAVAACSGEAEVDAVATLESTAPGVQATDAPPDPTVEGEQAALDFAQCMRDQGVDMGDPTVDAEGAKAEMEAIFAECEQLLDGVVLKAATSGSEVEFEDALLEYAGCMRVQGIDMPDPDSWGGTIELGGDGKGDLEKFEAAHEECREILARVGLDF